MVSLLLYQFLSQNKNAPSKRSGRIERPVVPPEFGLRPHSTPVTGLTGGAFSPRGSGTPPPSSPVFGRIARFFPAVKGFFRAVAGAGFWGRTEASAPTGGTSSVTAVDGGHLISHGFAVTALAHRCASRVPLPLGAVRGALPRNPLASSAAPPGYLYPQPFVPHGRIPAPAALRGFPLKGKPLGCKGEGFGVQGEALGGRTPHPAPPSAAPPSPQGEGLGVRGEGGTAPAVTDEVQTRESKSPGHLPQGRYPGPFFYSACPANTFSNSSAVMVSCSSRNSATVTSWERNCSRMLRQR